MPHYTFVFAIDPPTRITVTVPADTLAEAQVKAEAEACRAGRLETLGPVMFYWEEPPAPERHEAPPSRPKPNKAATRGNKPR